MNKQKVRQLLDAVKGIALKDYFDKNNIPYDPAAFPETPSCESCSAN